MTIAPPTRSLTADYISRLGQSTEVDRLGGKGANLSALVRAGFAVPDGFVVTTDAYHDVIESAHLSAADPETLRTSIPTLTLPDSVQNAVRAAYADLASRSDAGSREPAPAVAVRSSGTAEDLAAVSFAGQHDTYLDVSGADAVLRAVLDCWASLWNARAVAYRERIGWDDRGLALAVVVQRMVDAEWAGVMFTADPVSGRRNRIVVEAAEGVGEALVSGEVIGRHAEFDRATGALVSGSLGDSLRDGLRGLPDRAVRELVVLGAEVERTFGTPQDVEWTYAAERIQLVQARPLTALPEDPGERRRASKPQKNSLGMFAVTADHMPYPPFPMDVSLVYRPALGAVLGGIRSLGLSAPTLDDLLVEIDDGVVQIVPPRIRATWRAIWRVPAMTPAMIRLMRTTTDAWCARSDATFVPLAARLDSADLSGFDDAQLLASARELVHSLGSLMPSRFGAVTRGMASVAIVQQLLRAAVGRDRAQTLEAGLMSNVPCVLTSENADLDRLADIVRSTPHLRELYRTAEVADLPALLTESPEGHALLAEVDAHLRDYGYRSLAMFTVGRPPLRDTPSVVHGFIKGLAALDHPAGDSPADRYAAAIAELDSLKGFRARMLRPALFRRLASARVAAGFRDDSQYALEVCMAVTRRVLLELGDRLAARGLLEQADDIAYLEADEVEQVLGAGEPSASSTERLSTLVARRKSAREASLDHYTVVPAELFESGSADGRVTGMPASRGRVVGRVRVIRDESEFGTLQPGEVLVCPFTNPTWTPLFSVASAVVVDSGGAASHAAIVAREVGIPAVMGTGNGTRTLVTGQRVIVDADRGVVVPIDGGPPLVE